MGLKSYKEIVTKRDFTAGVMKLGYYFHLYPVGLTPNPADGLGANRLSVCTQD